MLVHWLGVFFIDKVMRSILEIYDGTHKEQVQKQKNAGYQQDSLAVRQQLEFCRAQISSLNESNRQLKNYNDKLSQQVNELKSKEEKTKLEAYTKVHSLEKIVAQRDKLSKEVEELRKCSLPSHLVPSTIIYAECDTSSQSLRKPSTRIQSSSLYEIHTEPGNLSLGSFFVLNTNNNGVVIQNRTVALRACVIDKVAADANKIVTIKPGKVKKGSVDWLLVEPAVVQLIKQ